MAKLVFDDDEKRLLADVVEEAKETAERRPPGGDATQAYRITELDRRAQQGGAQGVRLVEKTRTITNPRRDRRTKAEKKAHKKQRVKRLKEKQNGRS